MFGPGAEHVRPAGRICLARGQSMFSPRADCKPASRECLAYGQTAGSWAEHVRPTGRACSAHRQSMFGPPAEYVRLAGLTSQIMFGPRAERDHDIIGSWAEHVWPMGRNRPICPRALMSSFDGANYAVRH